METNEDALEKCREERKALRKALRAAESSLFIIRMANEINRERRTALRTAMREILAETESEWVRDGPLEILESIRDRALTALAAADAPEDDEWSPPAIE